MASEHTPVQEPPAAPADAGRSGAYAAAGAFLLLLVLFHTILAVRVGFYLDDARYSHCLLVPVISAIWIYDRWDVIRAVPRRASWSGFALAASGAALHLYGLRLGRNYVQHAAFLVALVGTIAGLWGRRTLRALAFPLGYLLFTIPLPKTWDDAIALPLQSLATATAEAAFDAFGWVVVRQGNVLQLPGLKLLVEDACSGVHSLYALVALGVAWVAFVDRPWWLRVTLVAATVPISVLANAIRVIVTGWLAYKVDPAYAQGMSHATTGMIVFAIGLVLFLVVDWCLRPDAPAPEGPAPQDGHADA